MKILLLSHKLEISHQASFIELLGQEKVKQALFVNAAAVPYGLNPKPDWLVTSEESVKKFAENIVETDLEDKDQIPADLSQFGFVFVSGGNTFYLAHRLKVTGFGEKLVDYIQNDGVYVGSSAGGIVLSHSIKPLSRADDPAVSPEIVSGLGLLEDVVLPHAESSKHGEIMEKIRFDYEEIGSKVTMIRDDQAYLINGEMKQILE